MDKVQKIREEVERIQLYTQSEVLKQVLDYINKVQEEPVSEPQVKESAEVQHVDKMCKENGNSLTQEPVSKDLEEASKEWLRPQLDKSYANYGEVKMMELTHFDGYAMLDAIEFGAKWQEEQDQSTIELAEDHAMFAGMNKMEEQMMEKAIDVEVKVDAGGYPYIDQIIELYDYDKDVPLAKAGEKVKVIVIIKEQL